MQSIRCSWCLLQAAVPHGSAHAANPARSQHSEKAQKHNLENDLSRIVAQSCINAHATTNHVRSGNRNTRPPSTAVVEITVTPNSVQRLHVACCCAFTVSLRCCGVLPSDSYIAGELENAKLRQTPDPSLPRDIQHLHRVCVVTVVCIQALAAALRSTLTRGPTTANTN